MITVRPEQPRDVDGIRRVTERAFAESELGYHGEADLVDALRAACPDALSLVAVDGDDVVGHILFTPATVGDGDDAVAGMGLAPMSVLPELQGQGVGSRLVVDGLARLDADGVPFVIVLGHSGYYPRFGFVPASEHGVGCGFPGVDDEHFMIRVLDSELALSGVARYHPLFSD